MNPNTRTGGQILVDQLIVHGVDHLFCVPGESYLAVLDALHDAAIAVTVCRQEGGAAMMAEAYGKLTGRPGICFVTRGPGATNASPGIHIAMQDSTPLILFVGQVDSAMKEREAFQELDYRAVFGTMAKWVTEIEDPARLPELISRAFHVATSGRPGPVVIALPEDMLTRKRERRRRAALRAGRDPSLARPDGRAAEAHLGGDAPDRDPRRQPLVGAGRAALRALCRALRAAGDDLVPPPDAVPGRPPGLRRRLRHRAEPEAPRPHQGRRPRAPRRRAHVGDAVAELHAVRHPDAAAAARPRASGRRRARPRLPSASCDQRLADCFLGGARGRAAAARDPLGRGDPQGACGVPRLDRPGRRPPARPLPDGRGDGASAPDAAGRHHHLQRRRQLRDLGAPLLALPALRHAARPDLRLDGLRRAGRRSARSGCSRTARSCALPATATS